MLKNKKKLMTYLFLGVGLMGLFLLAPDMVYAAGSGVTELDNISEQIVLCLCGNQHFWIFALNPGVKRKSKGIYGLVRTDMFGKWIFYVIGDISDRGQILHNWCRFLI